ncbi:MAG: dockerin type I domain-containing protein, partial [bacterium]
FTAVATTNTGPAGGGGAPPASQTDTATPITGICGRRADFNCDGKINSIDFSILLYFWKTKPPFANKYVDLNNDGKIDSTDFSILLYNWGKNK